jgi:hypothetical protein
MNATDVFLLALSFLVSGLLAGWIRYVSRQHDSFPGMSPPRPRDGELVRLSESLASALDRIEALERRYPEVAGEPDSGSGAVVPDGASEREVSSSQWRSAMDRLGPVWPSGSRSAGEGRGTEQAGREGVTGGREPRPAPASPRGTPWDDLFCPPGPRGEPPGRRERDGG